MRPRAAALGLAAGLLAGLVGGCAQPRTAPSPDPWEADIAAFEAADRANPPTPGGVVFVGSSSIRLWPSLAQDFPGVNVVQRGFGGSEMSDALRFAERIILPYRPRAVVVYAGDNDLWAGEKPEQIASEFRELVRKIHAELPQTRVGFIAVKPSTARWRIEREIRRTNELIREFAASDPRVEYLDVFTPMLDAQGQPRPELLVEDGLHMTPQGYAIWRSVVTPFVTGAGAHAAPRPGRALARR